MESLQDSKSESLATSSKGMEPPQDLKNESCATRSGPCNERPDQPLCDVAACRVAPLPFCEVAAFQALWGKACFLHMRFLMKWKGRKI
jgi:hypothetical protein